MTVSEFWDSNLKEIKTVMRAHNRLIDLQLDVLGWQALHVISPHVKRVPTLDQIRGRRSNKITHERPKDAKEFFAPMREKKRRIQNEYFRKTLSPFAIMLLNEEQPED